MNWTSVKNFLLGRPARNAPRRTATYRVPAAAPAAPAINLPRFKGTANDMLRGADLSAPADPMRLRLRKAFTPAHPVNDIRMFAGREQVLATLIRAIEEQQLHAVLFGDRGIGKTSLLHVLSHLARDARYIVRYTSCSETSEFDPTFRAIAADIPLLYHSDFDPTSEAAERGGAIDELLGEKSLNVAQVSELLAKLSGTRVLIVLDEFDRVASADFRRSIAELIKNLSDRSIRVQFVIAGVAANLTELIEHIPSIRRNVVGIPVTSMDADEVAQIIHIGEHASGMDYSSVVDRLVDIASGSPYLAGLLAQHSGIAALDREAQNVTDADVDVAIDRTLSEVGLRISPRGRQHLETMARTSSMSDLTALARHALDNFGVIPRDDVTSHASIVARAAEIGMLRSVQIGDQASYQFDDDSVPLYLWLASRSSPAPARSDAPPPLRTMTL